MTKQFETKLIEVAETVARIDERTKIMQKDQKSQTKTMTETEKRVTILESKTTITEKWRSRWWKVVMIVTGVVAVWAGEHVLERLI